MLKRILMCAPTTALLLAVMALPALAAEEGEETWEATWSNGHKIEKGSSFQLKFGGRIQADYTFFSVDDSLRSEIAFGEENFQDGFEFRRARVFFEGTIYDRVLFKAQYDFADAELGLKDVWIGLKTGFGKVRFGHFKEPFGLEELTSSNYIAFLERSLPSEAFVPSRNSGIGLDGGGDQLNWGVGGFYDSDDGSGRSFSESRYNLTGRIGFRPIYEDKGRRMLHLGAGLVSRTVKDVGSLTGQLRFLARPEAHKTTRLLNTGFFNAKDALLYNLEVAGVFDRLWFSGEYFNTGVSAAEVGDPTFSGFYVQAGYYLTDDYRRFKTSSGTFDRQKPRSNWGKGDGRGAWEIALRYSSLDLADKGISGGKEDNYTVAVNWYLNPATRLMINWVHFDVEDGNIPILGERPEGQGNAILLRWQVDF